MRFFAGNYILPFLVVLCFFSLFFGSASLNKTLRTNKVTTRKKSLIALLLTSNASFFDPEKETEKNLCRWLRGLRHQRKLCQRKKGLPEILQKTRQLALRTCQLQFQYEQWNCSTIHMNKFFKSMYRETAFMYSLATSALMYVVAQACEEGKLANCKCGSHAPSDDPKKWEWIGCSVNTKYASKFVDKFLQLKKKGDKPSNIMKHNGLVGLKVVGSVKECKCHGISGSCNYQVCRTKLEPFNNISRNLMQLYHNAIKVEPDNHSHDIHKYRRKKQLLFLDPSPNFCDYSQRNWGLPIEGRQCRDIDNCATLCCSNDYTTSTTTVIEQCNCSWRKDVPLQVKCDMCDKKETVYHCK